MINAILIGRGGSTGLPGKNIMKILGRPLMHYPILAALNSKYINNVYLSTDDNEIAKEGKWKVYDSHSGKTIKEVGSPRAATRLISHF